MPRAVHRLDTILSFFHLDEEHVLLILVIVTRDLPQMHIKEIRRNDF
jgi:hypothetical protein